jgi:hypothetical protein
MPVLGRGGHDIKERPVWRISPPDICLPNTPDPTACGAVVADQSARSNVFPLYDFKYPRRRSSSKQHANLCDFRTKQQNQPSSKETLASQGDWWSLTGSNRRPPECKSGALPAELRPLQSPEERSSLQNSQINGGPGTTRTSDLTLIRGAL